MTRLTELDSIRGLAAIAVVLYHYFYRYNEIYGHSFFPINWFYFGSFGVQLFFMVSGFVIYWSIENVKKPLDFIVSRFSRLYPVYWCAVLFTYLSVSFFGLPGREVAFFDFLVNLSMVQSYLKVPSVDGVYWTLAVELTFYFWVFVIYLTSNLKRIELIFSIFLTLSVFEHFGILSMPSYFAKIFLLEHLPYFLAGICFFKLFSSSASEFTFVYLIYSLFCILLASPFHVFFVSLSFFVLFYFVITGRLSLLRQPFLVFFGTISYPLYLVHQNFGYIIINKFYHFGFGPLMGIFVAFILSVLLSFLLTKFVEEPVLGRVRSFYKNNILLQRIALRCMPRWLI